MLLAQHSHGRLSEADPVSVRLEDGQPLLPSETLLDLPGKQLPSQCCAHTTHWSAAVGSDRLAATPTTTFRLVLLTQDRDNFPK